MFSLEQLRTFELCVRLGSFSAAARKLGKSQSSISQAIANLELDLGITLFDRTPKNPVLTTEGNRLLTYTKAVLSQAQELEAASRVLLEGHQDEIFLVIDSALRTPALFGMIERFHQTFPQINLNLMIEASQNIPELVRLNRAQFGLMLINGPIPTGVDCGFIGSLQFYVVAGAEHPLSKQSVVTYSDIIPYRQLLFVEQFFGDASTLPNISPKQYVSNDYESLKCMLESNFGWGYMPSYIVQDSLSKGTLCRLPVKFDVRTWSVPVERIMPIGISKNAALDWLEQQSVDLFANGI